MKKMPADKSTKPRRWFLIGPGLILAAILVIQILISNHKNNSGPPIVEHYVSGANTPDGNVPIDGINSMLKVEKRLELSSSQHQSLLKLHSEWMLKSKPLSERMRKASDEFNAFMAKNPKGRVSLSEIQSHAASVSGISSQVVSLRKEYWQKALMIMNDRQREILQRMIFNGAQSISHTYDVKRSAK